MPYAESRLEILQVRKLIQSVREKDENQVVKIVEKGVPNIVNYQDPESGGTALHVAVVANDEKQVSKLLELGAQSSVGNRDGVTPVMSAAEHGHIEVLQTLALKGVNAGAHDANGKTVLFHCLHSTLRHMRCLDFLLECGADANQTDAAGLPILCAVSSAGLEKQAQVLLNRGADPNAREPVHGKPALVLAAEGNHSECAKVLLRGKADKDATYGDGFCAVHRAAALGNFEVLQVLSGYGADFSKTVAVAQENAMHFAMPTANQNVMRFLGLRGCPANETDANGQNPQKVAKTMGRKDLMKEVKKLATFQEKALRGKVKGHTEAWLVQVFDWTMVHRSEVTEALRSAEAGIVSANRAEVEEKRRQAELEGAELPEEDAKEREAGFLPRDTFLQCLTSVGVPSDEEQLVKLAALHDKAKSGNVNYVEFLSEQKYISAQYKFGATDDLKAKKKKGKKGGKKGKGGKTKVAFPIVCELPMPPTSGPPAGTIEREQFFTDTQRFPLEDALPHNYMDDSLWYLFPPEREYMELYEAVRHSDMDSLRSALELEAVPVDVRDKYNKTPLMVACTHGRVDVVQYLIDKGADLNAIDNFCWTPLHHACHAGEVQIVKALLDAGAHMDAQGANGGTPLMRAIESTQRDIVKLLVDRGAKITLENKVGDNALEVARKWGDDYILALVYTKFNSLPPSLDKKGKDKDKDKGKKDKGKDKKKKKKGDDDNELPAIGPPPPPRPTSASLPTPLEFVEMARRRSSISSLKAATTVKPLPVYKHRRPPPQVSYHEQMEKARRDFGIDSADFGETRTPFTVAITARAQAVDLAL